MFELWQSVRTFIRWMCEPTLDVKAEPLELAAQARSMRFMLTNLSARQREQYLRRRYFDVIGGDSGSTYRIKYGTRLNIEELDRAGRHLRLLCFLPEGLLPVGDIMLAQKIAHELFEAEAVRIAHKTPTLQRRRLV